MSRDAAQASGRIGADPAAVEPPGPLDFLQALFARQDGPPLTLRRLLALALVLPPFTLLQLVHWIAFKVDDVLFPDYRDIEVREPLFVVGLPRSGTTFLHRTLALDEDRFTTLRLWELLLAPAVVERKLVLGLAAFDRRLGRPAGRLLDWAEGRVLGFMDELHPTSLGHPEEDYLFLLPAFGAFILILAFPGHPRLDLLSRPDSAGDALRRSLVEFYHGCLQRHLYVVGTERRLLSKNPSFSPFVEALASRFPDARFVACVRDPREAVASQLSSLEGGARFFGWSVAEPAARDRILDVLARYGDHLSDVLPGLPEERWTWCSLARLGPELERELARIYRRFQWHPGAAFRASLEEAGRRSRRYRSRHRHRLEDYGLTPEAIRARFRGLEEAAERRTPDRAGTPGEADA
jgi:hypothetical protein